MVKVEKINAQGTVIESVEYVYDVFDQRIGKSVDSDGEGDEAATIERFVYDGDHIALTFDGEGNLQERFLHGVEIDQVIAQENADGEVLWGLGDYQGTIRDVIDGEGEVIDRVTYDSFGRVTGETDSEVNFRFGYTGRELDSETGLYYYRARYYDPSTGRFISEDPIVFLGGDANLYRYVFNSPTNYLDPSGLEVASLTLGLGLGLGLGSGLLATAGAILTAPVSAPVAALAIGGSAVIGGAIGLYNSRQNNIDSLPPEEIPHNTPPFPNSNLSPDLLKPESFPSDNGLPWFGTTPPFPGSIDDGYSYIETFPGADCLDLFKPFFEADSDTIWDSIKPTQDVYPGSVIPKSFELTLENNQKVWVHGNATEHIAEYAVGKAKNFTPEAVKLASQTQLKSLQSATNQAFKDGVKYGELTKINGWELIFQAPRSEGQLPALTHALYK